MHPVDTNGIQDWLLIALVSLVVGYWLNAWRSALAVEISQIPHDASAQLPNPR